MNSRCFHTLTIGFSVAVGALAACAAESDFRTLDLRPVYNRPAAGWPPGTSWGGLPHGRLTFDGVPFDVDGVFQLTGMNSLRDDDYHVQRVVIPAGQKAGWIHLLHGLEHVGRDGEPLWEVVLHYDDGARESFPIGYATHAYDWWERPFDRTRTPSDPNFAKVWNGSTSETAQHDSSLRLFRGSIKNPHPDKPIQKVEAHTLYGTCSPFIMAVTLGSGHAGAKPAEPFQSAQRDRIPRMADARITVKGPNGQPVQDASLFALVNWEHGEARFGQHQTGADGRVTIEYLPDRMNQFQLTVAAPGYAATKKVLELAKDGGSQLEILLAAGSSVQGLVTDHEQRPVADALVTIQGVGMDAVGQVTAFTLGEARSNAQGRWLFASASAQPADLMFTVTHPDYFEGEFMQSDTPSPAAVSTASLRDGSARFALKPGHGLAGQVVGPDGHGVAKARVIVRWSEGIHGVRETVTDARGEFALKLFLSQPMDLTVIPEGELAPTSTTVDISAETPRQLLKVSAGSAITGTVLDEEGNPASDVVVELGSWNSNKLIAWKTRTAADGRFEWRGAPTSGELRFNFMKPGFQPVTGRPIAAGTTDVKIQFQPTFALFGRVVDANTGEPVPSFTVVSGRSYGGDQVYWERHNNQRGVNGAFTYTPPQEQPGGGNQFKVMIEADGYWPAISEAMQPVGRQTNVFRLKPGQGASGLVVRPDGTPVEGAQVTQLEGHVQFAKKRIQGVDGVSVATGADGRFKFPPRTSRRLIAVHDTGYGELTFDPEKPGDLRIVLEPYGVVEGVAYAGRDLLVDAEIMIADRRFDGSSAYLNYDWNGYKTNTDAEGRFRFVDVPAGERQLVRLIKQENNSWMHGTQEPVRVSPGQTSQIKFGGKGAIVVGRVVPDDPARTVNWRSGHHNLHTVMPQPKGPFKSREEAMAWQQSEEVKEAQKRYKTHAVEFFEDGRFRITDVAAGDYQLNLNFTEPGSGRPMGGEPVGRIQQPVKVPETATTPEAAPLELGELTLTLRRTVEIGSPAPDFETKDFAGKPIKLSDLRGKYVFLDFWAVWCGPCVGEIPHLKAAYEALKGDDRFVMLSLSLDPDVETPKKFTVDQGMNWRHGFLGEWSQSKIPDLFGVQGIPATFLIGPDGKVLAKNLRGETTKDQIVAHLK